MHRTQTEEMSKGEKTQTRLFFTSLLLKGPEPRKTDPIILFDHRIHPAILIKMVFTATLYDHFEGSYEAPKWLQYPISACALNLARCQEFVRERSGRSKIRYRGISDRGKLWRKSFPRNFIRKRVIRQ